MRRFYIERTVDVSGVSGIGKVAEGCVFDSSWVGLTWLTDRCALSWYPNIETVEAIHGHGGSTRIVWIDEISSNVVVTRNSVSIPPSCSIQS